MAYGRGGYGGNRGGGGSYGRSGGGRSGGGGRRGRSNKEYDNSNQASVWGKDERDLESDKHPDLNGKINITVELAQMILDEASHTRSDSVDLWFNGWTQHDARRGDSKPMYRFAIGKPCSGASRDDDNSGRRQSRRDDYDRNRRDDSRDDRGGDRGGRDRDGRDGDRDGNPRDRRYDGRQERDEDERRDRDDRDRGGRGGHERPFDEGRDGERGGSRGGESRGGRDDDRDMRDRPGPNDYDGGPAPEGQTTYDKDRPIDDEIPF